MFKRKTQQFTQSRPCTCGRKGTLVNSQFNGVVKCSYCGSLHSIVGVENPICTIEVKQ